MHFKTKILLALILANFAAWSYAENTPAEVEQAVQLMYTTDPLAAHAVCAAWIAIVAEKMGPPSRHIMATEAQRHADIIRGKIDEDVVDAMYQNLLEDVQQAYNARQITWAELVMAAESCTRVGVSK